MLAMPTFDPSFASSQKSTRRRLLLQGAACASLAGWPALRAVAGDSAFEPLLASLYSGQAAPSECLVSEKYDGVRAVWDGRVLRHRSGRAVAAPPDFVAALPEVPLDGELWLGRGRFEALSALVRRAEPQAGEWSGVRYMVFEMPGAPGSFAARSARLSALVESLPPGRLVAAPQKRVADREALMRLFDATVAAGGEGLMLHRADAPWTTGRGPSLMKLKPQLDAEAVVVAHRRGSGKYRELVGALDVAADDGRRFRVGSGLSDALRHDPPPLGSRITYRYQALTGNGLPRFPTYLRRYVEL